MVAHFVTGVICVALPPMPTTTFGAHEVPPTAKCTRVTRHANYVVAEVGIGTPLRIMNILLNLNEVVEQNAFLVHSTRVSESSTITCDESVCNDVMLVNTEGPAGPQQRVIAQFEYKNPTTLASSTSYALGLDGELTFSHGKEYFLTATHFCFHDYDDATLPSVAGLGLHMQANELCANASDVVAYGGALAKSDAIHRINAGCGNGTSDTAVALFPEEASNEAAWLGLQNSGVYQTAPDDVAARRNVVEVGTDCSQVVYPHAHSLFQLDCLSAYTACETLASIPFRRVATQQLRFAFPALGSSAPMVMWAEEDPRLYDLPRLNNEAFFTALVKLVLMVLSALVIWVRAGKVTSSHSSLFLFCMRATRCLGQDQENTKVSSVVVIEDAVIGLLAIAARFSVLAWRFTILLEDNQMRVLTMQLVAAVLSFLHWLTRNFALEHYCELPLTKLGGSTAIVDATAAVMLAFASSPLLVSAGGRFDSTARMLVALIIATITLVRVLFAASCCGLAMSFSLEDYFRNPQAPNANNMVMLPGFEEAKLSPLKNRLLSKAVQEGIYVLILVLSASMWLYQAACIGGLLADVFVTPLTFSMHRSLTGNLMPTAATVFVVTTAVGLPNLLKNAVEVAREPVIHAKKPS